MKILVENDALIFTEDDPLGLAPYHARQIKNNTKVQMVLSMYFGTDALVMRPCDKRTDRLVIPADLRGKICESV